MAEVPRKLGSTDRAAASGDASRVAWKLDLENRHLDANLIRLPPGGAIAEHTGGEVDVLVHVVAGSGVVGTEGGGFGVAAGDLVWLPRFSTRSFTAGNDGLGYLTVHLHREPSMTVEPFRANRQ
jgi:quercetin dioxygenase-like cupin family protein